MEWFWILKQKQTHTDGQEEKKKKEEYLQMSDGKDDGVGEVDFIGVLVDGRRDNRRVDNDGVIGSQGFAAQLHAGVLRWQVVPDVFVQDECNPNLTCKKTQMTGAGQIDLVSGVGAKMATKRDDTIGKKCQTFSARPPPPPRLTTAYPHFGRPIRKKLWLTSLHQMKKK